jgi:hypothetical protein
MNPGQNSPSGLGRLLHVVVRNGGESADEVRTEEILQKHVKPAHYKFAESTHVCDPSLMCKVTLQGEESL